MPSSTPTLAAHVTPIPTLTPHWGALLGSQVRPRCARGPACVRGCQC
jgi:hypothetical protein